MSTDIIHIINSAAMFVGGAGVIIGALVVVLIRALDSTPRTMRGGIPPRRR